MEIENAGQEGQGILDKIDNALNTSNKRSKGGLACVTTVN
jgi:hypothetical protein